MTGFYNYEQVVIELFANGTINGVFSLCVATTPTPVKWGYVVVNEKALYDANNSIDFNLHRSEETILVIKTSISLFCLTAK